MSDGVRCMWMRGGTSKGAYFLSEDLPPDIAERDAFLLRIMGSPDPRQIDGIGGADPLTSKVAVIARSARADADVDYLFLQVFVDQAIVSDSQNCGNILAGVGPFAIERGLVKALAGTTPIAIHMQNTGQIADAIIATPGGQVRYSGDAKIDGVPGTAAPIPLAFRDVAGSSCGALLPTGNAVDDINGVAVTLIDNGMPCVVIAAADAGISGYEDRETLDGNVALKSWLETIRRAAGPLLNLGDVTDKSVPKMMLVAAPKNGGAVTVRSFIPHRCHASIGVFGAVTVATACLLPGSPAALCASVPEGAEKTIVIEHPSGVTETALSVGAQGSVTNAAILRTARRLFDGLVFS